MVAYHPIYDYVTCGLTAKKLGSAPSPTLIIYEITLIYLPLLPRTPLKQSIVFDPVCLYVYADN